MQIIFDAGGEGKRGTSISRPEALEKILARSASTRRPDAFDELHRLLEAPHAPVWVKVETRRLGQLTFKLFHYVCEPNPAFGTSKLLHGPHASYFLRELIQAYVALDRPRVRVLE